MVVDTLNGLATPRTYLLRLTPNFSRPVQRQTGTAVAAPLRQFNRDSCPIHGFSRLYRNRVPRTSGDALVVGRL